MANALAPVKQGGLEQGSIHQIFKEGKISILTFYLYYKKYTEHVKGRILKKDLTKAEVLLSFFDEDVVQLSKINLKEL